MNRVRIVTDSTADIPGNIIDDLGIKVVPLKVSFGSEVYRDGIDIQTNEFITRLKEGEVLPTTSQPSPGEFVAVYEKIVGQGEDVISIHLSGDLSGTVQSARTARTMTDSGNIHIVDSRSVSMGLGLLVIAAAQAAKEGKSVREILTLINHKIEKTVVLFLVDTLEYLERGGRIGKASAFLGSFLKIKPILGVSGGQVVPVERARGKSKALERLMEIALEKIDISKKYRCSLVYGNDYSSIGILKEQVENIANVAEPIVSELGPVIMAHAGPGVMGIVLFPE